MASKTLAAIAKGWWSAITKSAERFFLFVFALALAAILFAVYALWDWLTTADVTWPAWFLCLVIAVAFILPIAAMVAFAAMLARKPDTYRHTMYREDRFGDGPHWHWRWSAFDGRLCNIVPFCPDCGLELIWRDAGYGGVLAQCDTQDCDFAFSPQETYLRDYESVVRRQIHLRAKQKIEEHEGTNVNQ